MKLRAVIAVLTMPVTGCGGESEVAGLRQRSLGISEGMTVDQVRLALDTPGLRSIRQNREAWQYCASEIASHT